MKNEQINKIEFFHFKSDTQGERLFKVDWINNDCIQVVLNAGVKKTGRPNMLGIYKLSMASFRSSYYWFFERTLKSNTTLKRCEENDFKHGLIRCFVDLKIN